MTAPPKDWIPEEEYQRMINVLTEVSYERKRIFRKYGTRNFTPVIWLPILIEEVGEVGQAICKVEHGPGLAKRGHMLNLRNELIQVAAVAVAMVESLDRNELKFPKDSQDFTADHDYQIGDQVIYPAIDESPFVVVGIRKNALEIEGDFSGCGVGGPQKDWVSIADLIFHSPAPKRK